MTDSTIEGKVAQVVNTRELIINVGLRNGVREGMVFAILAATPLVVRDPDTNEALGEIDREKVRVKASEVHDAFAVCRTFQTRVVRGRGFVNPSLFDYMPTREVPVTLKVEDSAFPPALAPEESYVKRGDRVRSLEDQSESEAS